ncbi:MAG TPA: sigma-70 family RNA polymerase sigma factor [Chitinophagaceae bacterium]|jgi:RNA polymerase sigma-70 factor (ECF subfamily)
MKNPVEKLWFQFGKQISEFICLRTSHRDHCHDILQNVYLKVIRNIDKIEAASNIKSYLIRTADNTIADFYRDNSRYRILNEIPNLEDKREDFEKSLQLADCCLRPMIESLPPGYRDALIMADLEGISQRKIAEKLNLSLSGAKSRVQRARSLLKEVILKCCNYEFDRYGNIIKCTKNPSSDCCK